MKLIVGFGNPGKEYNFTRHNFGFLALDFYVKIKKLSWESSPKFSAEYLKTSSEELGIPSKNPKEAIYFIKPQDFYNNSGVPVTHFARFFKIPLENILILCDDFNLNFGTLRLREKGSDGGNNGLKSCIRELGSNEFKRLRLGSGNDALRHRIGDTDFVLGKFTPGEKEKLPEILRDTTARIDEFLAK